LRIASSSSGEYVTSVPCMFNWFWKCRKPYLQ